MVMSILRSRTVASCFRRLKCSVVDTIMSNSSAMAWPNENRRICDLIPRPLAFIKPPWTIYVH